MNRNELQRLAEDRLLDAQALLAAGRWSGAYYLAGYAIECALKSCVLAYVERTGVIFVEKKYSEKCWTHDLEELVRLAGLEVERDHDVAGNPARSKNWVTVRIWTEVSRYQQRLQSEAEALVHAIDDPANGVFPWIKARW